MKRKTSAIPPIRVGNKHVTYTPPGPDDVSCYDRLVFRCEILALRLDGAPIDSLDGGRSYNRHDVRADLLLPDGTVAENVPYTDQGAENGRSWCRPYISSVTLR